MGEACKVKHIKNHENLIFLLKISKANVGGTFGSHSFRYHSTNTCMVNINDSNIMVQNIYISLERTRIEQKVSRVLM